MPHREDHVNWISWCPYPIKLANPAYDGTGAPNWVVRPLPRTLFLNKITLQAGNATNIQTVARVFINNGGDYEVPENNTLVDELTLTQTTAVDEASVAIFTITLDLWLPAGYRVNVLLGTAVSGGFHTAAFLGQYSEASADAELYEV